MNLVDLSTRLAAPPPQPTGTLDCFLGSFDSGDQYWCFDCQQVVGEAHITDVHGYDANELQACLCPCNSGNRTSFTTLAPNDPCTACAQDNHHPYTTAEATAFYESRR